jgi:hypothetical protein
MARRCRNWIDLKEDVMRLAITTIIATTAMITEAHAAGLLPANDGIFNWAVLGFCAAILVGQTIPAARLIVRVLNGVANPPNAANQG